MAKPVDRLCSSPTRLVAMLALALLVFLVLSTLGQIVLRRRSGPWRPEPFSQRERQTAELSYVYMDGCGHCKQFDPTWKAFTGKYKDALESAGVHVQRVKNTDGASKDLGVRAFPSVVIVSDTNDFPQKVFDGDRSVDGLVTFVHDLFPSFPASA